MMAGLLLRASSCLVVASVGGRVANSVIRCFSRWVAEGGIALARIWPTGNRACCPQLPSKQIVPIFLSPPRAGISASYISYRSSGPCGASGSVWKLRHSLNGCRQGLLAVISSSRELDRRNKWLKTVVVLHFTHRPGRHGLPALSVYSALDFTHSKIVVDVLAAKSFLSKQFDAALETKQRATRFETRENGLDVNVTGSMSAEEGGDVARTAVAMV
ncbi:hypothetical protein IWZ03DRAFT_12846 [Phyllosticta citriasiana]|uniref:Secreted protein n=1 Tax=Phyllosticta citriasiana TaxID=595635 RepID=A0ABR1L2W3_9PEZI